MGKGLLWCLEQPCVGWHQGGEEERRLHSPRPLPHQDQDKTSNKSMCEGDVWQGDSSEGKASEDSGESFPCCSPQEADLVSSSVSMLGRSRRGMIPVGILQYQL